MDMLNLEKVGDYLGMTAALCAFNIADIILIAVILLAIFVGIVRGFAETIGGGVGSLIAIALAIVGVVFLKGVIQEQSIYLDLKVKIADMFKNAGEGYTYPAKVENGSVLVFADNAWGSFTDKFSGFDKFIANLVEKYLVKNYSAEMDGNLAVIDIIAGKVANLTLIVVMFIVFAIVAKILLSTFARLANDCLINRPDIVKVDKAFGFVFSALFITVLMFGVFYYLAKTQNQFANVKQTIDNSTVTKWLYDNNPFLKWI